MKPSILTKGDKLPNLQIGPFKPADLIAYATASGDTNPLHLDEAFAQRCGFAVRPVHGMRILSAFEQLLSDWRENICLIGLKGQFLTPVLVGEYAMLSGRVAKVEDNDGLLIGVIRLMAHTELGALALLGEATMCARLESHS